jgi:hypothetical protein
MKFQTGMIAVAAMLLPVQAPAQDSPAGAAMPSEHRLSPEQIEAVLEEAAAKNRRQQRQSPPELQPEAPKPQVHGEVGVAVGTGGYREVFGTAVYPLGEDGAAAISMDFVDLGQRRYRR